MLERLVELVVVALVSDMDGTDEIDFESFAIGVGDGSRAQLRCRAAFFEADEIARFTLGDLFAVLPRSDLLARFDHRLGWLRGVEFVVGAQFEGAARHC